MQILVYTADESGARAAIADCFAELTRLEQVLSEWIPTSDVSRVNLGAGTAPVKVGPDALAVVTAGKQAAELTNGAFALTWLALAGLWRIPPPQGEAPRVPAKADVDRVLPLIGDAAIVVDATASTVQLPRGGMAIGVGAIGKGYAMDRVADLLARRGFKNMLVSAGGDVVARGSKGARPWSVGIQDPRGPGYFAVLNLVDQAISTAGDYERYFEVGGVRYHHILDPHTGYPARGTRSVTVIADKGTITDGLDTGIFVMGPQAGMKLIEDDPRLEGVIIDDQNAMTVSSGLAKTLRVLRQPTQ
ncbi:MAG: FAD:protein FMN transferase [Myxococcota bacterium]